MQRGSKKDMGLEFLTKIEKPVKDIVVKELSDTILTVKQFSVVIEKMVKELECSYLEALTLYADKNGVEIETVGSLVKSSHVLKAKLAAESEELGLIKSSGAKLPLTYDQDS